MSLEIMTYGQGYRGASSVYFDGIFVGSLTDGDNSGEDNNPDVNIAWIDTFDLMSFGISLDGVSTITIDTASTIDWWYVDYSELTITGTVAPVPESSTALLFGIGLLSLAGFGRRIKNSYRYQK